MNNWKVVITMLSALRNFAYRSPYRFFALLALLGGVAYYAMQALDTEQRDSHGRTQLIQAAEAGDMDAVQRLLRRGAEVDACDDCRWTAMMKAANNGHTAIVQLLLEHGADVNAQDKGGYTALMVAAANGYVDTVQLLLARGAHVDVQDQGMGWSALIWAAKEGEAEVVRQLLAAGAQRELRDSEGLAALDWAVREQRTVVIALLQQRAEPAR
jgi:ankyrin repeat protein